MINMKKMRFYYFMEYDILSLSIKRKGWAYEPETPSYGMRRMRSYL